VSVGRRLAEIFEAAEPADDGARRPEPDGETAAAPLAEGGSYSDPRDGRSGRDGLPTAIQ
jgi:hypothetical protein